MDVNSPTSLPPGFRFHPTDEELIVYYLRNQTMSKPCPVSMIPEVDIYKFDPWQLPEKCEFGENEWYFFSPRDRKYPNGLRPNRATVSGYWKATGTDKAIYSGSSYVGVKKALVFYNGRPPRGTKTDWIMHEYCLNGPRKQSTKRNGSMRLDDWVLCRIYKKKAITKLLDDKKGYMDVVQTESTVMAASNEEDQQKQEHDMLKLPRTSSIGHFNLLLEPDYAGNISQIFSDNSFDFTALDPQMNASDNVICSSEFGDFQANQNGILSNHHPFMYQFQFQ